MYKYYNNVKWLSLSQCRVRKLCCYIENSFSKIAQCALIPIMLKLICFALVIQLLSLCKPSQLQIKIYMISVHNPSWDLVWVHALNLDENLTKTYVTNIKAQYDWWLGELFRILTGNMRDMIHHCKYSLYYMTQLLCQIS